MLVDGALVNPFGVGCSYCGAGAGEQCHNKLIGMPMRRALAHSSRIHDAMALADAEAEQTKEAGTS